MTAECLGETCTELIRSKKTRLTKTGEKNVIYREIPQLEADDFKEGGNCHRTDPATLPPSFHACLASPLLPHSNKHNGEGALDTMLPVIENRENNQGPVQLLS